MTKIFIKEVSTCLGCPNHHTWLYTLEHTCDDFNPPKPILNTAVIPSFCKLPDKDNGEIIHEI